MKITRILLVSICAIGLCLSLLGEPAMPKDAKRGKLLYLTLSAGFHHDVVPFSTEIVKQIGDKSGAFETTVAGDVAPFTSEGLKPYDAVMFYTTGELPMNDEQKNAFVNFIRSGHGFVGVHSATDTFYLWKDYADIIGGYFNGHPWHQQVTIDVADPANGLVSFLAPSFQVNDEIYQIDDFNPETSHVLLRLNPASVDLKKQGTREKWYGWPVAWTRKDGKGRSFYCSLGHEHDVWNDPRYQQLLLNGIKWAMGK
jgi:type 1 glutamine amidotransferase